jgi:soluble lytic murein transglycosylase-like protein
VRADRILGATAAFAMLFGGAAAAAQSTAGPSNAPSIAAGPFAAFVAEAAQRFGVPPAWIEAVIRVESLGDPRAISPKGAVGLLQIMPQTWQRLRARYGLGADPFDPRDNILAGTAYLRDLHERYGAPGFLAAYDAGPARWEAYVATGRPLPGETRAYLTKLTPIVGQNTVQPQTIARAWTEAGLFPARSPEPSDSHQPPREATSAHEPSASPMPLQPPLASPSNGLFVALSGSGGTS